MGLIAWVLTGPLGCRNGNLVSGAVVPGGLRLNYPPCSVDSPRAWRPKCRLSVIS
jgi:uncharacterized membrane-anchored protein